MLMRGLVRRILDKTKEAIRKETLTGSSRDKKGENGEISLDGPLRETFTTLTISSSINRKATIKKQRKNKREERRKYIRTLIMYILAVDILHIPVAICE